MNSPRVPDDQKNWESIDIFLFSNGQQYSPPRKYHLKSEELKWWEATLSYLARSQFGSIYSSIDIYTLDGKKIDTPLGLVDDAAYVAVKSPDTFIQSGYEKYLIKATRSREKRQEKMNSTEMAKSAKFEINKEQLKSVFNDITLKQKHEKNFEDGFSRENKYLITVVDNTTTESQQDTKSVTNIQTTNNSLKIEKPGSLQKRKLGNSTNNTIIKKNYRTVKSKNGEHNISKKVNTFVPKNVTKNTNNNKSLTMSTNNPTVLKQILEDKVEANIKSSDKNTIEIDEKPKPSKLDPLLENSLLRSSEKDLTVLSDVYKNTESDIQSVFLDADRKTAITKDQRKVSHELKNMEQFGVTSKNCLNTNNVTPKQNANNFNKTQAIDNISNRHDTFHLYLNVNLNGCTVYKNQDKESHEIKCKSYVTLIKPEKASQVNIDVTLCKDHLNFGNNILISERSELCFPASCQESIVDNNTRVIVVHCRCNLFKSDKNVIVSDNSKGNDEYFLSKPIQINDEFKQRSDLETRRISDKETQELLHSCIRIPATSNSEILTIKKPEPTAKHKVSISQAAPRELNSDNAQIKSQGDTQGNKVNDVIARYKINNSTQTDWCNVLLQAKFHEDGRYTFYLPSLSLLTQYNLL